MRQDALGARLSDVFSEVPHRMALFDLIGDIAGDYITARWGGNPAGTDIAPLPAPSPPANAPNGGFMPDPTNGGHRRVCARWKPGCGWEIYYPRTRRRKRMATKSDIADIATMASLLGKNSEAFKTWLAKATR